MTSYCYKWIHNSTKNSGSDWSLNCYIQYIVVHGIVISRLDCIKDAPFVQKTYRVLLAISFAPTISGFHHNVKITPAGLHPSVNFPKHLRPIELCIVQMQQHMKGYM